MYSLDARVSAEQFEALESDAQLGLLHRRLIEAGVLPEGSDIRNFRGFIEVYKANLRLIYAPEGLHASTRVLLLRSREQQPEALVSEQFAAMHDTRDLGWTAYFDRPISVGEAPGDHLTMMISTNAKVLAATLSGFLTDL